MHCSQMTPSVAKGEWRQGADAYFESPTNTLLSKLRACFSRKIYQDIPKNGLFKKMENLQALAPLTLAAGALPQKPSFLWLRTSF